MISLRRFAGAEGGNVAVLFGLALIPVLALAGGAIDHARAVRARTTLQKAIDAATLGAAQRHATDPAALESGLRALIGSQLEASGVASADWRITEVTNVGGRVSASAEVTSKNYFLPLLRMPSFQVAASTEVALSQKKLEVALVLDSTGSMATNNRIGALREAAKTLVDTLYAKQPAPGFIKIALVPFVTTVNIKAPGVFDMAWMDTGAKAKYHGVNFNKTAGAATSHFALFTDLGRAWKGCVEARAEPYDVEDTAPDPNVPDTLFVPWFWPDEPDDGPSYKDGTAYNNDYMPDDYVKPQGTADKDTAAARQSNITKYKTKKGSAVIDETPSPTSGPNKSCPEPLTPLTDDAALMRTRIDALRPWNNSGTNIALGMSWGWSALSPTPPFTEGAPYDDEDTEKAMIVLTDGENEVFGGWNTHNKSDYSGYNYLARNRLGSTDRAAAVTAVNDEVAALCGKIKAQKIRLYTITFELNSATAQALLRNCATDATKYYNSPSTAELKGIFQTIANELGDLRFSR